MIVYYNGRFLPKEDVHIAPDDRGFVFGDGVYEVVSAYAGQFFEMEAHLDRLERSLHEVGLTGPGRSEVKEIARELLRRTDLHAQHAKLYLQVTRGAAARSHAFPEEETASTVYAMVTPYTLPEAKWERGVKAIRHPDLRWARCDIKSIALLPNVMASQRAKEAGAFEAILERDGIITEGSHSTVLGVFDGTVVTHPLTPRILPSVTRAVVIDLCDALDLPVVETPIEAAQLAAADELLVLGTTTGVMPVVQVGDEAVADGRPGPITRKLQQAYRRTIGV